MRMHITDTNLDKLAKGITRLLKSHNISKDRNEQQKAQMEGLAADETLFKTMLIRHKHGDTIFRGWIKYITDERRNIMSARPFFRERNETFKKKIAGALATREPKNIYEFQFNGFWVRWVMGRYGKLLGEKSQVAKVADRIFAMRREIAEQNLPLVFSQAKIFRNKTAAAPTLEFMDMIQVAVEGLMSAIDKYAMPWTPVFRGVIVGRAKGNLIAEYSEPFLHFFPLDRQKIYRANRAKRRNLDLSEIVEAVNMDLPEHKRTNEEEIQVLMNASSHTSLDQTVRRTNEKSETYIEIMGADESANPELAAESNELGTKLSGALSFLSVVEKKALALKGYLSEVTDE